MSEHFEELGGTHLDHGHGRRSLGNIGAQHKREAASTLCESEICAVSTQASRPFLRPASKNLRARASENARSGRTLIELECANA